MSQRAAPEYRANTDNRAHARAATSQTSTSCAGSICNSHKPMHTTPRPAAPTSEIVCACPLKRPHSQAPATISAMVHTTKYSGSAANKAGSKIDSKSTAVMTRWRSMESRASA